MKIGQGVKVLNLPGLGGLARSPGLDAERHRPRDREAKASRMVAARANTDLDRLSWVELRRREEVRADANRLRDQLSLVTAAARAGYREVVQLRNADAADADLRLGRGDGSAGSGREAELGPGLVATTARGSAHQGEAMRASDSRRCERGAPPGRRSGYSESAGRASRSITTPSGPGCSGRGMHGQDHWHGRGVICTPDRDSITVRRSRRRWTAERAVSPRAHPPPPRPAGE